MKRFLAALAVVLFGGANLVMANYLIIKIDLNRLNQSASGAANTGKAGILYGWRTRNPIVWAANAKICEKVTPSLLGDAQDQALQAACVEMCSALYPGKSLEVPSMIMRGTYGHIKHQRQAYHGTASRVDAAMSRIIPDSADALFSVGVARI